nr:transposase [Bacteroides pyogenes]
MHSCDPQQERIFYESVQEYCGKGKSTMGWYIGFKLHLLCNEKGEIINFVLTKANVDDRNEKAIDSLTDKVFGKLCLFNPLVELN